MVWFRNVFLFVYNVVVKLYTCFCVQTRQTPHEARKRAANIIGHDLLPGARMARHGLVLVSRPKVRAPAPRARMPNKLRSGPPPPTPQVFSWIAAKRALRASEAFRAQVRRRRTVSSAARLARSFAAAAVLSSAHGHGCAVSEGDGLGNLVADFAEAQLIEGALVWLRLFFP